LKKWDRAIPKTCGRHPGSPMNRFAKKLYVYNDAGPTASADHNNEFLSMRKRFFCEEKINECGNSVSQDK
jgi:hypothetical protein